MTSPSTAIDEWLRQESDRVLAAARATGAYYVDLFAESFFREQQSVRVRLDARRRLHPPVYRHSIHQASGAAVRAFGPGVHVQIWCSSPGSSQMLDAARQLATQFKRGPAFGAMPLNGNGGVSSLKPPPTPDSGPAKYFFERLTDAAFSAHPGVSSVRAVLRSGWRRTHVYAPNATASTKRTVAELQVRVLLDSNGQSWPGYAFAGGMVDEPEVVALSAVERARSRSEARPLGAGNITVVMGPGWGGIWLHEAAGHALEADTPNTDATTPEISPLVSIVDDARIDGGRASTPVDDEGVATQRTQLVRAGVRTGVLADRYHAQTLGLPLTGNGRRQDYRYLPLPRMTNIILETGRSDPEDLVADVSDGLYVSEFDRGQYDSESNILRLRVRGAHRIVTGRLQEAIEPVEIVARPEDLLANVCGVGNDFELEPGRGTCRKRGQNVPVSVGAPTVLFAPLDVRVAP